MAFDIVWVINGTVTHGRHQTNWRCEMTKNRVYTLTAVSAALYIFLTWAFADGQFSLQRAKGDDEVGLWLKHEITNSSIWTYVLLAVIILAGVYQASRTPEEGVPVTVTRATGRGQVDDPSLWKLLMTNTYWALLWLPLRFFVGRAWLGAGEHKLRDSAWMDGGQALKGYWTGATTVPEGATSSKAGYYDWYHDLLTYMLNHEWYTWFAKIVAVGEFLIGIGLIVGALVGIAAFFGTLLNFSFIMAGTTSSNPVLFGLGVFLVLGWKVAGWFGIDRVLLPALGTPWQPGTLIEPRTYPTDHPGAPMRA